MRMRVKSENQFNMQCLKLRIGLGFLMCSENAEQIRAAILQLF